MSFNYENIKKSILDFNKESLIVYIGSDSKRLRKKNKIRYATVIVLYCTKSKKNKIFKSIKYTKINDNPKDLFLRLYNEAQETVSVYENLYDVLDGINVEIHIDINPNKKYKSNIVYNSAVGLIKSVTGLNPVVKPDAFIASNVADHFLSL